MDFKLSGGDWVPDGKGGFVTLTGAEETLQRALLRLTVRRGILPFWPDFGSELSRLGRVLPSQRDSEADRFVFEALQEEPELMVRDVTVTEVDGQMDVSVWLSARGVSARLDVTT